MLARKRAGYKQGGKALVILMSIISGLIIIAVMVIVSGLWISISGNSKMYSVKNTAVFENSPIKSMRILFLGSSVTYGSGSRGESFVDFLEKKDGVIPIKEAVPGTTLADIGKTSYIPRLKALDASETIDAFVCQLSTNDASKKIPLGNISGTDNFCAGTVAGAIETIISYVRKVWNCPIVFYTGTRYNNDYYNQMVALLLELQKKWDIGVIDLWNDAGLNNVPAKKHKLYTVDGIHPTKAGYKLWWLPKIEAYLYAYLGGNRELHKKGEI